MQKIPVEHDEAEVYAYSDIGEAADCAYSIKLYDKNTYDSGEGTPYCKGDKPWDVLKDEEGKWVEGEWKGTPSFVIVG